MRSTSGSLSDPDQGTLEIFLDARDNSKFTPFSSVINGQESHLTDLNCKNLSEDSIHLKKNDTYQRRSANFEFFEDGEQLIKKLSFSEYLSEHQRNEQDKDKISSTTTRNYRTTLEPLELQKKQKTVRKHHKRKPLKNISSYKGLDDWLGMRRYLKHLDMQQSRLHFKRKRDRKGCKLLHNKIHKLLKRLKHKIKQRNKYVQKEYRIRTFKENQRPTRNRLTKMFKVVFLKRQERLDNMRSLRLQERKRIADSLLFKAAKLRANANRLTGGFQTHKRNRRKKTTKKSDSVVTVLKQPDPIVRLKAGSNENIENVENNANLEEKKVTTKKLKNTRSKLPRLRKKCIKYDREVMKLNKRVKKLLRRYSTYDRRKPHCKRRSNLLKNKRAIGGEAIVKNTTEIEEKKIDDNNKSAVNDKIKIRDPENIMKLKKCKSKRKHKVFRCGDSSSWWRKGKMKKSWFAKESLKPADFGSDSDVYHIKINDNQNKQISNNQNNETKPKKTKLKFPIHWVPRFFRN